MITRLEVNNYRCLRYNIIPKGNDHHLKNERTSKQREMFPAVDLDEQKTLLVAPGKKKSPKGWRKIVNKTETGNDYFGSETLFASGVLA